MEEVQGHVGQAREQEQGFGQRRIKVVQTQEKEIKDHSIARGNFGRLVPCV